jgi:uncharacterized protein YecT (DUF1311 family)
MSSQNRLALLPALLAGIAVVGVVPAVHGLIAPIAAAGAAQPVLFSVAAHDPVVKGGTPGPCDEGADVGEENCLARRTDALDGQIDATAAQILLADKRDESGPGAELTAAAATSDLSAAQRTWLSFRAADCQSWSDPNAGGTIVGIDILECAVRDDQSRLAELRAQLKAAAQ